MRKLPVSQADDSYTTLLSVPPPELPSTGVNSGYSSPTFYRVNLVIAIEIILTKFIKKFKQKLNFREFFYPPFITLLKGDGLGGNC
jgi:hypothetical protein